MRRLLLIGCGGFAGSILRYALQTSKIIIRVMLDYRPVRVFGVLGFLAQSAMGLIGITSGRLGGAGGDVLAIEPPRSGSPLLDDPPPNLIVTPHVAWASREARQRLLDEVALNIVAFGKGRERNRVA